MKHYSISDLIKLTREARELVWSFKKIYTMYQYNEREYKIYIKLLDRLVRRRNKKETHKSKLAKQTIQLDKAEKNLMDTVKKSNAGRPKKADKKSPINVKLPPYLIQWMDRQPKSRAFLMETAMCNYYQIPDHIKES